MNTNIHIRTASDKDLPILEDMASTSELPKQADYFEQCLTLQKEGAREIFILSCDGEDAGYAIFNRAPRYAFYDRMHIPEIQDMNVAAMHRKKGLGTALISHCEDTARNEGYEYIGISVGLHSGYGAAQRLYCKLDYYPDGYGVTYDREPVPVGEMRPLDDWLCLMMIKEL